MTASEAARLRASPSKPDFETLQQQNPGRIDRLCIRPDHFSTFSPASLVSSLPVVLSIDPGQRGGSTNSFSVVQAWAVDGLTYLLLAQWREQAAYGDFRHAVRHFIRKYRPSVILIEATAQGPALSCDIRPQNGMEIVQLVPTGSKIDRLRRHRRVVRPGRIQLPEDAPWRHDFINEITLFPLTEFDDQVDALTQFLDWISKHPNPEPRPAMALIQGVSSRGVPLSYQPRPLSMAVPGAVLASNSWRKWR